MLSATSGRGVDVVLNSLTGDLLHSSWNACAEFGTFIEIGKRDILDHGHLDMTPLRRNLSLVAFDLSNFYLSAKKGNLQHRILLGRYDLFEPDMLNVVHVLTDDSLLEDSLGLIRAGLAKPVAPMEVFDVSKIGQAFRQLSNTNRIGKVVVSMEDPQAKIKVSINGCPHVPADS